MYPSNKLNGGEPLFSGDYGECYCPHCGADDAAIGDCGDTAATAWNYQQGRIDALVKALEKAQAQSSKWLEAYHKAVSIGARYEERIAELESRTVKLPGWFVKDAIAVYDRDEIEEALAAAGIKWEAE
ncbi:hypothetical protein ACN9PN_03240 [Klebsiella pasteurii]|uniref:hypothetical protein n=1 Tax=Klebsiella pasteurii TaxID=2587529 RepID=UPI003B22727E